MCERERERERERARERESERERDCSERNSITERCRTSGGSSGRKRRDSEIEREESKGCLNKAG